MCVARKNSTGRKVPVRVFVFGMWSTGTNEYVTECNLCACVIKKDSVLKYKEYLFLKIHIRAAAGPLGFN
jgi:hypothetical protein